nr:hypothetical protein [Tanacetum cinerariifolium]
YPDVHPLSQETSDEVFQANHSIQNEESFENPSNEIAVLSSNLEKEEPSQDSDFHQLIEECSTEICEEQKQSMEDTMLELVKIYQEKEFLYIHDDVDDLIESDLNSKLLSINSNFQRLDKKEQEVKNVVEQPAERGNRSIQSLQNFRVVQKNSISFRNTSQISSIHAVTPILSTKEPEHSLSMGYEHLSITPETESDEVTKSNAKNLLPIPSECKVTLKDESKCDLPISKNIHVCDNSNTFSDSKIDDDILVYDDDFEDIEYVEASLSDPGIVSEEENGVEEENDVHQEEEEEFTEYINTPGWNRPALYNNGNDDDEDCTIEVTPDFLITDSLIMGDEHLDTILEKESNEFIKSSVENLVPNPSDVENLVPNPSESEGENGCDVPACFTNFSNILFDVDYDFDSVDDQSLSDEDISKMSLSDEDISKKIFSNPMFMEEIISMKIDPHHFNAESDLIESLLNHDSSIIPSSSKIDSLLDEFVGKLTLLKSIPPGIDKTDCYPEEDIRFIERLLYDNSSPRLPEEFDSNSFTKEIDLSFKPDDPMPPTIEEDDYDSERDILILEELLDN